MPLVSDGQFFCEKCHRTMMPNQFYSSNNLEKYPEGKVNLCKQCLTMHVDNWDPETYTWILEECDVPYVPEEWNRLLQKYAKPGSEVTGMTIMGRYLSLMRLRKWKEYRWCDTEHIQEVQDAKVEQAMRRRGYSQAEIDEAQAAGPFVLPPPKPETPQKPEEEPVVEDYFANQLGVNDDDVDLTEEDVTYLRLKWGNSYRPHEWVALEQMYNDMMDSYDIQAAGDINTLKLACKTSLKANQLLDLGDIDGAQKCTKMYDNLMKSGKWTAAQNKAESNEDINTIGELVALCERQGFIPRFYSDGPNDKLDRIIEDMQRYTHELIVNETNLGVIIESAAKQMIEEEERIAAASHSSEETEEDKLFNYDSDIIVTDDDIEELNDFVESEHLLDLQGDDD